MHTTHLFNTSESSPFGCFTNDKHLQEKPKQMQFPNDRALFQGLLGTIKEIGIVSNFTKEIRWCCIVLQSSHCSLRAIAFDGSLRDKKLVLALQSEAHWPSKTHFQAELKMCIFIFLKSCLVEQTCRVSLLQIEVYPKRSGLSLIISRKQLKSDVCQ